MKKILFGFSLVVIVISIEFFLIIRLIDGESSEISNRIVKENHDIMEIFIPVNVVMQNPELPNGCEVTALTAVLNYYGYPVTKTEMADHYLPKQPFARIDGVLYGANPYEAYAGDPRNHGDFFSYAPPIVEAANSYLQHKGESSSSIDISGSSKEEIIELLQREIPVVIWVTKDLRQPNLQYSWYLYGSNKHFLAPVNLHAVVLNGYTGDKVHAMDPLKGQILYEADTFFESYQALGSHALIVERA